MRERGLKSCDFVICKATEGVAPHAGAWIEISPSQPTADAPQVAPHAGAWIEIVRRVSLAKTEDVAPHAGAWIEIDPELPIGSGIGGRSPCGSVD